MFYEKVLILCKNKGISPSKLMDDLKMSRSNFEKWEHGATPQNRTIKKIADYFGVPVESFNLEIVTKEELEKEEPKGEYIYLDPRYKGQGIPPEILQKITDFFTK